MMLLIDTHTHLYSSELKPDLHEVIVRAKNANVYKCLLPAIDRSYYESMYALHQTYPQFTAMMMGLHPCSVKEATYAEELQFVKNQLNENDYVAVGEIGIDLFWDKSTLKFQQMAFDKQINWAIEKALPINIHCRDGFDEAFEILQHYKNKLSGTFHCFTGTHHQALQVIDLGLTLGIGGVVTFKNGKIDQFLHQIPIEHIVLETDSPYLAPVPFRGKRNESAYLLQIAQKVAEIYKLEMEEVANITTQTANRIYKLTHS